MLGIEDNNQGVIDLLELKTYSYLDETLGSKYEVQEIPSELMDEAKAAREKMIETVSEVDDHLMEKYLTGTAPSVAELKVAIRKGTISLKLFPVICGSAFKNK